jgi:hypothetical protein
VRAQCSQPLAEQEKPSPEAVDTLWQIAEDVLADERTRGQNLDTKTAALATFSGTILALDATLGQGLFRRDLGCVGDTLLPIFFLIAATALVVAAGVAVIGVLRPQKYLKLEEHELRSFARFPMLAETTSAIQGRMLRTLTDHVIPAERSRNDGKATLSKVSAISLGIGLVGVAGQAVTLGLHELGV